MKAIEFKTFLFEVYNQTKHLHHIAKNIPIHNILGDFYKKWDELNDQYIETYSGIFGDIKGQMLFAISDNIDPITFLEASIETIKESEIMCEGCSDLLNIQADMIGLCHHTIYLLNRADV